MKLKVAPILMVITLLNLAFILGQGIVSKAFYKGLYDTGGITKASIITIVFIVIWIILFLSNKPSIIALRILLSVICIMTVSCYGVFITFLPKYTAKEAYNIVKDKPGFTSGEIVQSTTLLSDNHSNTFVKGSYLFYMKNEKSLVISVMIDPVTKNEFYLLPSFTQTSIMTKYFCTSYRNILAISKDNKLHLQLYFNRSEDNVKAILAEMGENELKTNLKECVNLLLRVYDELRTTDMVPSSDLEIEIRVHDVDVATCKDGNILLKNR